MGTQSTTAPYASPPRRVFAWFLDAVIAGIVFIPLNPQLYTDPSENPSLWFALGLASTILVFPYLIAFDGGPRGAPPGKRIVGIRVADDVEGGAIGYRRAAVRRLGYLVGGLLLFAGWWWALFDRRRQTWHDKLARSVVVRRAA
jgi:uncharacterized RDD family membrane protein YckC